MLHVLTLVSYLLGHDHDHKRIQKLFLSASKENQILHVNCSHVPPRAHSLVVLVKEKSPTKHYDLVLYNLPPRSSDIWINQVNKEYFGLNDWGHHRFHAPQSKAKITVYALDERLDYCKTMTGHELKTKIKSHLVAMGEVVYSR